ncbi:hypothetical protein [Xanthomonas translucens]|uniref:hypothetical protein n=1 Tax=Xanthomonas campestris pv. translucens TaxID=343 RepID=UPI003CCEC25D
MVFRPIALAMRIRCSQSSRGIRSGCISPLRICHGWPSSTKCACAKPNVCGRPSGTGAARAAAAPRGTAAAIPSGASTLSRQKLRRFIEVSEGGARKGAVQARTAPILRRAG